MNERPVSDLLDRLVREFPERGERLSEEFALSEADPLRALALLRFFTWGILEDAIRAADGRLLDKCYRLVEDLLVESDGDIRDAVRLELCPALLSDDEWAVATRMLAGPRLAAELDDYTGDRRWRIQSGSFGRPPQGRPREVIVDIYRHRDDLLMHGRDRLSNDTLVITTPFARLPARTDATAIGSAVLTIMNELAARPAPLLGDFTDEFLRFAEAVEWDSFYSDATGVQVLSSVAMDEITVWPPRGVLLSGVADGSHAWAPIRVPGWAAVQALGAAVLHALNQGG